MAETTIEWTRGPRGELGYTFNGWIGCTKVSPGCDNCYAAAQDKFRGWTSEGWGAGKPRRRTSEDNWDKPKQWNKAAEAAGERRRVFCSSLADVFDNEVPGEWRADLFALIRSTPHLDWLLLTKRIGNARPMIEQAMRDQGDEGVELAGWPWPNVWLGATIVNQEEADRDIPKLLAAPARARFLSMEPLLGPVRLDERWLRGTFDHCPEEDADPEIDGCQGCPGHGRDCFAVHGPRVHWIIVGGESGHGARPMHPDWARSLRDQCAAAGVPFLFKQHGEWLDDEAAHFLGKESTPLHRFSDGRYAARVGKKAAGRLLDGVEHNGFPEVPNA